MIDTITDPAYQGPQPQGRRIPRRALTPTLFYPPEGPYGRRWDPTLGSSADEQGTSVYLPLGAVVAVATLADVVPIYDSATRLPVAWQRHIAPTADGRLWLWEGPSETENPTTGRPDWRRTDIADQRSFGDYSEGRFAWLLEDVRPLPEPVPWRGQQAAPWSAPAELVAKVEAVL
ncbi:MAG TPA: hypothetical protein VGB14_01650, partial [Acidimicrobiales bacterium]